MKDVLCITSLQMNQPDPHVKMVQNKLDILTSNKVKIHTIDSYTYPLKERSYFIKPNSEGLIINDGLQTYSNKNIGVIWYRKPYLVKDKSVLKHIQSVTRYGEEYLDFVYTAYQQFSNLYRGSFSDIPWISSYWNIIRGNNRIYNLETAKDVGLTIPNTLITSSANEAYKFYLENNKEVVSKTIQLSNTKVNGINMLMYAQKLDIGLKRGFFNGLCQAPAIFQQFIKKVSDIRVTVVGDTVLAGEIISHNMDWRKGNYTGGYKIVKHNLPKNVEQMCTRLTKSMGLEYSAIDLGKLKNGKYVYFENNPNGQWGFVEHLSGLDISGEIAKLIIKKLEQGR